MKIDLHNIYYYFLTCNNKKRKDHIINEFKNFKLVEVNPIMNIGKIKSGATGFSRILDQACIHQDKNKPFQPFAIFEDDVKKFDEFPLEIEIPNDTDILYIGLSICGMNKSRWCNTVCSNTINDNIIRIYPHHLFCDDKTCNFLSDNSLHVVDYNHPSSFFASRFAELIKVEVDKKGW